MKTPVYIDFRLETTYLNSNELDLNKEDPVDIYIDALLQSPPVTKTNFVLAPRYYLLIHSPADKNLSTIKIPIHKSNFSKLKNQVRILLEPSGCYGINSSYKVEYWEWIPNIGYSEQPSKRKINQEYWYVPTLDNNFIPQYPFYSYLNNFNYYNYFDDTDYIASRLFTEEVTVSRTVNNISSTKVVDTLPLDKAYIFSFDEKNIIGFREELITEQLLLNEETSSWTFSKALGNSLLTRELIKVDGIKIPGTYNTTTNIDFIMPFNKNQLIIDNV